MKHGIDLLALILAVTLGAWFVLMLILSAIFGGAR